MIATDKLLACCIYIDGVFSKWFSNKKPDSASLALLNSVLLLLRGAFTMVYIDHLGSSLNSKIKHHSQQQKTALAPSTINYKSITATQRSSTSSELIFLQMQAEGPSASAPMLFERFTTPHHITSILTTSHCIVVNTPNQVIPHHSATHGITTQHNMTSPRNTSQNKSHPITTHHTTSHHVTSHHITL